MSNRTVPATAEGLPASTDPTVIIGRQIGAHSTAWDRLTRKAASMEKATGATGSSIRVGNAAEHEFDFERAARHQLSCVQATTLAGAAIQISEAIALCDLICDAIPEGMEGREAQQDRRSLDRLLYSALSVVDRMADSRVADNAHASFANPQCNPWAILRNEEDAAPVSPAPSPTVSELFERRKAHLAAYSAAPIDSQDDEKAFFATADTEAGLILASDPPPIASRADLIAALQYIEGDEGFVQEAHARLVRSALAYLEGGAA